MALPSGRGREDKPLGRASRTRRFLVTGGGTGGHIYPALSIAGRIKERVPSAELLYVGTMTGLEARLVPRTGIPFAAVAAGGVVGKAAPQSIGGALLALRGLVQACRIVRRFRPDVVIGTGGYVSGPVGMAAVLCRVPLVIQEQNVLPGVTNRLLGRFASLVAVAYPEVRSCFPSGTPVEVTGNPVRPEVLSAGRREARSSLGITDSDVFVVIFMGSRGSATVNRALVPALRLLADRPGIKVLYATGEDHFDRVLADMRAAGLPAGPAGASGAAGDRGRAAELRVVVGENIVVRPYINDMTRVLAAADLVVSRAGAITLAEITARGLPALLIPSPHVTHRHQERNAEVLARHGAARVVPEEGLTGERLAGEILALIGDRRRLAAMGERSRSLGRPGALDDIVDRILRLAGCREV